MDKDILPEYGPTLGDRSWMWGHESWQVDGKHAELFGLDVAKTYYPMVDGAKNYGLENLNIIRWDMPDKTFRDTLKEMKRLTWPMSGAAGEDHTTYAEMGEYNFMVAEEMPNVTGFELDDYLNPSDKTPTFIDTQDGHMKVCPTRFPYSELLELRKRMHAFKRPLELRMVTYDVLFDGSRDLSEYKPIVEVADSLTYWTWEAKNMSQLKTNFAKLRSIAPKKAIYLGIYLWDFGGKRPMPLDALQYQLETGLKWFRSGEIEGMVFLCSSICNRDFEAVKYCREWIFNNRNVTKSELSNTNE